MVRSNPAQVERLNNFSWVGRAGDGSNAHTQSTEILKAHIREELQGLLAGFDSWVASGRTFPKTITRNGVKRSPRLYIPGLRWAHVAQDYIQKHTVWAHLAQACVLKHTVFQSTSKPRNIRANQPRASPNTLEQPTPTGKTKRGPSPNTGKQAVDGVDKSTQLPKSPVSQTGHSDHSTPTEPARRRHIRIGRNSFRNPLVTNGAPDSAMNWALETILQGKVGFKTRFNARDTGL